MLQLFDEESLQCTSGGVTDWRPDGFGAHDNSKPLPVRRPYCVTIQRATANKTNNDESVSIGQFHQGNVFEHAALHGSRFPESNHGWNHESSSSGWVRHFARVRRHPCYKSSNNRIPVRVPVRLRNRTSSHGGCVPGIQSLIKPTPSPMQQHRDGGRGPLSKRSFVYLKQQQANQRKLFITSELKIAAEIESCKFLPCPSLQLCSGSSI